MTAGSGILHEELLPAAERLLGVQLWLNLPAKEKMTSPRYHKHQERRDSGDSPERRDAQTSCREISGTIRFFRDTSSL